MRYTITVRRGIEHLFKELLTDTDWGLLDMQHPMYRRRTTEEKKELKALIEWLIKENPKHEGDPSNTASPECPLTNDLT